MIRFMRFVGLAAIVLLAGCSTAQPSKQTGESPTTRKKPQPTKNTPPKSVQSERTAGATEGKSGEPELTEQVKENASDTAANEGKQKTRSGEPVEEVVFGTERMTLTEALGRAEERIKIQKETIRGLEKELKKTRSELKEVRTQRDNLRGKMETYKKQLSEFEKSMAKWKKDVLGFRDEIRHSEKAEMQALKQIIILLRKAGGKKASSKGTDESQSSMESKAPEGESSE